MIFNNILQELMKEKGVKVESLADFLSCDCEEIEDYLIGIKEPRINILVKLADYFDVTTDYLIGTISVNLKYKDREDLLNKIKLNLDKLDESDLVRVYYDILKLIHN